MLIRCWAMVRLCIGCGRCLLYLFPCINKWAITLCLDLESSFLCRKSRTIPARGGAWTFTVQAFGFVRVWACVLAVAWGSACLAYLLSGSTDLGIVAEFLTLEATAWRWNIKMYIKLLEAQRYFLWESSRLGCQEEGSCWLSFIVSVDRNSVGVGHKGRVFIPRWGIEGISDLLVGHARCSSAKFCHSLSRVQGPVGGDLHRDKYLLNNSTTAGRPLLLMWINHNYSMDK